MIVRALIFYVFNSLCFYSVIAQAPIITTVEPLVNYPGDTIIITGNNLGTGNSEVWFDQVRGEVISSSNYFLKVAIPTRARYGNIEVINKNNNLSAKSLIKFLPTYNAANFSVNNFTTSTFSSTEELWDLCSCDFDQDNKADIISTKFSNPSSNALFILRNNSNPLPGSISFNTSQLALGFQTDHASCGDLNGDGRPDLVVTRAGATRNSIHILKNSSTTGVISFATPLNLFMDVSNLATRSSIKDLNKDGKPEIVISNSFNNVVYVFVNQSAGGNLSFNATPVKISVTGAFNSYGLEVQDFNGDTRPDIIISQFQTNDFFILKNESTNGIRFAEAQKISVSGTFNKIISSDFNGDGLLDIAAGSTLNDQQSVVLLNESTMDTFKFGTPIVLIKQAGPWGIDVADINGDKYPDIIIANRFQNFLHVFLNNTNAGSTSFIKNQIATNKPVRNVLAGDIDGDGKPDLAVTAFSGSAFSLDILRNTNCFKPIIINEEPQLICSGQHIRLNSIPSPASTFKWMKDGVVVKETSEHYNDLYNVTAAGSYTVEVTQPGCGALSDNITISAGTGTLPSGISISSNTPLCSGSSLNLASTVTNVSYKWTGPNGYVSTEATPNIDDITRKNSGEYALQIMAGGCVSDKAKTIVSITDLESFNISSSVPLRIICEGSTINLAVDQTIGYTYQWRTNGNDLTGSTSSSLTTTEEGTHSVIVTYTSLACNKEFFTTVDVLSKPIVLFEVAEKSCSGQEVTFSNTSISENNATNSTWSFGDNNTSSEVNPTHIYNQAESYNVTLTVKYNDLNSCSSTASKSLTVFTPTIPSIKTSKISLCPDDTAMISIDSSFKSIRWSNGSASNSTLIDASDVYTVNTIDENGCTSSASIEISELVIPELIISSEPNKIIPGQIATLHATGSSTDKYMWLPTEGLGDPTHQNTTASPRVTTTFIVRRTSIEGCVVEGEVTVLVDGLKIPVAFSPNGDGQNEIFVIEGLDLSSDCTLSIFDGRGTRVFEQKGYTNDWSGTYRGIQVPDGTYYYVLSCPDKKSLSGNVLIFR
jgi:gliding motility-associated-like protein